MLNPITYTERVVEDFLRYQLTTYPFTDERLARQMRELLSLARSRETPLLRGPYVSLSRPFEEGPTVASLVAEGLFHPHMVNLIPHPTLYGHQGAAVRHIIAERRPTIVSTGTGSGKTECFLYPIISRCLALRDEPDGIVAVVVYPMNALAEDQLGRLRALLCGTGVTFGMYVGGTPERDAEAAGVVLRQGASKADYERALEEQAAEQSGRAVHPPEERASREAMRSRPPRILLTNVKQLEYLLTRQKDVELFDGARLELLVFDEAHTFSGAAGAESACLVRRLREFCGRSAEQTVCVATSATIADPHGAADAPRHFASRFFGVAPDSVAVVTERYARAPWPDERVVPPALAGAANIHLDNVLSALRSVEDQPAVPGSMELLRRTFESMTGTTLDRHRWRESLYERLAGNEVVYQIAAALERPRPLAELVEALAARVGRPVPEEEVLLWLALGAAARDDGRPLLRPVVHAFVRGVGGAVVTFADGADDPVLWLSAEDAGGAGSGQRARLPVLSCTTCGQHYFEHHLEDFGLTDRAPSGGRTDGHRRHWRPLDAAQEDSRRVVLLDRSIGDEGEDGDAPKDTVALALCRRCGTASLDTEPCSQCGSGAPVPLLVVRQKHDRPGKLTRCVSCGTSGRVVMGRYREPARPVRALAVADVHVLAQSLIQHAERRRLLVFTDNRQDAAFQAGWMQDRARRYRLRALMAERLRRGPVGVSDLAGWLDALMDQDDDLSRVLVPEVWRKVPKSKVGVEHQHERRYFLTIQVLREITTSPRQRIGLEPWGRLRVEHEGLDATLPFFLQWAPVLGCSAAELRDGVATLLDGFRRRLLLHHPSGLYSRFWRDGAPEVVAGYLPLLEGVPKGLKLRRDRDDDERRIDQLIPSRNQTVTTQAALRWGVPEGDVVGFVEALWRLLTELGLLVPVTLRGVSPRLTPLPRCAGAHQIDADRLLLTASSKVWRCRVCRRTQARRTPGAACVAWRCRGTVEPVEELADDYDLSMLDQPFAMLRPREHSAQVPRESRERVERLFKGPSEAVNTLVCTPTLELGVDIGELDAVLMRNVPPLPANYWQRAGRAGRRNRMSVNLTYARQASHDRAFFADPMKMLAGPIDPPSFNLRNEEMVRKHVHAAVLTELQQVARRRGPLHPGRDEVAHALSTCFPTRISAWLFDSAGNVRTGHYDVTSLGAVIARHRARLLQTVERVFAQSWPAEAAQVVTPARLGAAVDAMPGRLDEIVRRVERRLAWAMREQDRLDALRRTRGSLEPDEEATWARCSKLIKRLKGVAKAKGADASGQDDTYTYAVLAAEGFLPGYGLETGTVVVTYVTPRGSSELREWELRRGTSLALRESSPGNLLYANGHRFVPRQFHLDPDPPLALRVDPSREVVVEATGDALSGLGDALLPAVRVSDVDLAHFSQISDEEEVRFQVSVATWGYEQDRHEGGAAWLWGTMAVQHRRSVHLRLVNVGVSSLVQGTALGYPVCETCGQSRSALSSAKEIEHFSKVHEDRCGVRPRRVGFYADVVADALSLLDLPDRGVACSVVEALRHGAADVLEMELDDLQILALAHAGDDRVDMALYDPMPGGSGLLDQMVERWPDVVEAALRVVRDCPSRCDTSCPDCLREFRNAWVHRHLDRRRAEERLAALGDALRPTHPIPPRLPARAAAGAPDTPGEATLHAMLERAGLGGFSIHERVDLGRPVGATIPDVYYADPTGRSDGLCVYLDGMSRALHGDPERGRLDAQIRAALEGRGYEVRAIAQSDLTDRQAMATHFYWIARRLLPDRQSADRLRDEPTWFESQVPPSGS